MNHIRLADELRRLYERYGIAKVEKHHNGQTWAVVVGSGAVGSTLITDYLVDPEDSRDAEFESATKAREFIAEALDLEDGQ